MKLRALFVCSVLLLNFGAYANQPTVVDVPLEKSYIPIGFDTNDQAQIVVAGVFNNTCYQVGPSSFIVDQEKREIQVKQTALLYSGACLQVKVPFYEVIDLGLLNLGNFQVVDQTTQSRLGEMPVKLATSPGPTSDDFPYAPVSNAFIVKAQGTDRYNLILQGVFTNRCMKFKRADLHYYDDVVVVLPIVEMIEDKNDCTDGMYRFQQQIPLKPLKENTYLFHIRSMSGKAINKIFNGLTN